MCWARAPVNETVPSLGDLVLRKQNQIHDLSLSIHPVGPPSVPSPAWFVPRRWQCAGNPRTVRRFRGGIDVQPDSRSTNTRHAWFSSRPAEARPLRTRRRPARQKCRSRHRRTRRGSCICKGRDLADKLRITDARRLYTEAVAKDPKFALAYLGLATTAGTTGEFVDATKRAVALAGSVSEGERHIILAGDAGLKGDPAAVLAHYNEAVRLFPNDERVLTLLGIVYFGRQDYETAIKHYVQCDEDRIPISRTPYNQLGYAYRFLERYDEAETTFKKYIAAAAERPESLRLVRRAADEDGPLRRVDQNCTRRRCQSIRTSSRRTSGIGNDHLAARAS